MYMVSGDDLIESAAVEKLQYALKVKQVNDDLLEQLASSLRWLVHYSEKYGIVLPEKDKIVLLITRAIEIEGRLPPVNEQPNRNTREGNTTQNLVIPKV